MMAREISRFKLSPFGCADISQQRTPIVSIVGWPQIASCRNRVFDTLNASTSRNNPSAYGRFYSLSDLNTCPSSGNSHGHPLISILGSVAAYTIAPAALLTAVIGTPADFEISGD